MKAKITVEQAERAVATQTATFNHLVVLSPALAELEKEAKAYKRSSVGKESVCANDRWYGYGEWKGKSIRRRLIHLVGWCAGLESLKSCYAYDLAYHHLYDLLPDCKACRCMSMLSELTGACGSHVELVAWKVVP